MCRQGNFLFSQILQGGKNRNTLLNIISYTTSGALVAAPVPVRFLVDKDFFFDSPDNFEWRCFLFTNFSPSSKSSNRLSTDPPRFLKVQIIYVMSIIRFFYGTII